MCVLSPKFTMYIFCHTVLGSKTERRYGQIMYNDPFDDFDDFDSPGRNFPRPPGSGPSPGGGPFPPGRPPGRPPGPPGQPPFGGPGQAPTAPPPTFTPAAPLAQSFSAGASGIGRCLFRNTYIWLRNGRAFWFFPISTTRERVIGFRWSARRGWVFSSINRSNILTFSCFF